MCVCYFNLIKIIYYVRHTASIVMGIVELRWVNTRSVGWNGKRETYPFRNVSVSEARGDVLGQIVQLGVRI
jgi:hypothetical protein